MTHGDSRLLRIFQAEQQEHLQILRTLLAPVEGRVPAASGAALDEAFRRAHTLKGAARAVGIATIEDLAHRLETVLARVRDGGVPLDEAAARTMVAALDAADDALAAVLERRPEPDVAPVLRRLDEALARTPAATESRPPQPPPAAPLEAAPDSFRVSASSVDELIGSSSELLAATSAALEGWRRSEEVSRQFAELERELTLAEADACRDVQRRIRALAGAFHTAAAAQRQSARTLHRAALQVHDDARRVRMTPADTVFEPFRRMVRELARDQGKEVEFEAEGMEVRADRLLLQRMKDPVMHLLRNAITHGVEPPKERAAAGKPAAGVVRLKVETQGDRLALGVYDDGRGVDLKRVADLAAQRGLAPDNLAASRPDELLRLLFQPGFSTSTSVSRLSGRGMGLSVVHEQVTRLQGDVVVRSRAGAGFSVQISVPLSVSTVHVLLIAAGDQVLALPSRSIDRLCRVRTDQVETVEGRRVIRVDGDPIRIAALAELVGETPREAAFAPGRTVNAVILRAGGQRAAFAPDSLVDEREVVVKDLGIPFGMAGLAGGAVPLEDGTVAVALNPLALVERIERAAASPAREEEESRARKPASILVVDDSITTRSLEKSILEAHGYRVRLAVDGVDALTQMKAEPADLVIADLSMPRMDGFQLLERIKSDKRLSATPVIIVSSLESAEDKSRGLSLGADAYIVKRKFDQRELLETVRQVL